jgi:hypothetical protein
MAQPLTAATAKKDSPAAPLGEASPHRVCAANLAFPHELRGAQHYTASPSRLRFCPVKGESSERRMPSPPRLGDRTLHCRPQARFGRAEVVRDIEGGRLHHWQPKSPVAGSSQLSDGLEPSTPPDRKMRGVRRRWLCRG